MCLRPDDFYLLSGCIELQNRICLVEERSNAADVIVEFCNVGEGGAWQFKTYLEKGESVVVAPEERFYLSAASDLKFQLQLSESKPIDVTSHALSDTKTELAEYLETEECVTTLRSFSTHSVRASVV